MLLVRGCACLAYVRGGRVVHRTAQQRLQPPEATYREGLCDISSLARVAVITPAGRSVQKELKWLIPSFKRCMRASAFRVYIYLYISQLPLKRARIFFSFGPNRARHTVLYVPHRAFAARNIKGVNCPFYCQRMRDYNGTMYYTHLYVRGAHKFCQSDARIVE